MRFKFNQGVPDGCIKWLWDNIGVGNLTHSVVEPNIRHDKRLYDDWFYERIRETTPSFEYGDDPNWIARYVPTITVYNKEKAVLFTLKWV